MPDAVEMIAAKPPEGESALLEVSAVLDGEMGDVFKGLLEDVLKELHPDSEDHADQAVSLLDSDELTPISAEAVEQAPPLVLPSADFMVRSPVPSQLQTAAPEIPVETDQQSNLLAQEIPDFENPPSKERALTPALEETPKREIPNRLPEKILTKPVQAEPSSPDAESREVRGKTIPAPSDELKLEAKQDVPTRETRVQAKPRPLPEAAPVPVKKAAPAEGRAPDSVKTKQTAAQFPVSRQASEEIAPAAPSKRLPAPLEGAESVETKDVRDFWVPERSAEPREGLRVSGVADMQTRSPQLEAPPRTPASGQAGLTRILPWAENLRSGESPSTHRLHLRMDNTPLGPVNLDMAVERAEVALKLGVENPVEKSSLLAGRSELAHSLSQEGLALTEFGVGEREPRGRSKREGRQGRPEADSEKSNEPAEETHHEAETSGINLWA